MDRIDTVARARQLAAERNIPLSVLAKKCGINHSTLDRAKSRGGQLQVETIYRICEHLRISVVEFFTIQEEQGTGRNT